MEHDVIFSEFAPKSVTADGRCDVSVKKGWIKHAPRNGNLLTPRLPKLDEDYFDWILTLESVKRASGVYRMAELGAGWGVWASRAIAAAAQRSTITDTQILAIEADRVHYGWLINHFKQNALMSASTHLIEGAVANSAEKVKFPVLDDPSANYGASLDSVYGDVKYVEVDAFTVEDVIDRFDGPLDFLHVDVQGAEYDTLPRAMPDLLNSVKIIKVGTHKSTALHKELATKFIETGWIERMNYPRGELSDTPFGKVQFGDGLLAYNNPNL
jgi:FkbM family methyltransferase